nr:uncharacterized protein LOC100395655 [Callithrix jacchus]
MSDETTLMVETISAQEIKVGREKNIRDMVLKSGSWIMWAATYSTAKPVKNSNAQGTSPRCRAASAVTALVFRGHDGLSMWARTPRAARLWLELGDWHKSRQPSVYTSSQATVRYASQSFRRNGNHKESASGSGAGWDKYSPEWQLRESQPQYPQLHRPPGTAKEHNKKYTELIVELPFLPAIQTGKGFVSYQESESFRILLDGSSKRCDIDFSDCIESLTDPTPYNCIIASQKRRLFNFSRFFPPVKHLGNEPGELSTSSSMGLPRERVRAILAAHAYPGMRLWPLRPSFASPDPEQPAGDAPGTLPRRPVSPSALAGSLSLASRGSAPRTSWSARETELLLGALLLGALLRQALAPSRRVLGELVGQQVHRPRQCRRRHYRLLRVSFPQAQGQPSGPLDEHTPELTRLPGDHGRKLPRRRYRGSERPQQGRGPAPSVPAPARGQAGAAPLPTARSPHADPAWTPHFNRSPRRSADTSRAPPPLNAALLLTLGHLHRLMSILGPLRDQLRTLNQHVEHLRGAFCKTVSLAVGFVLGSAAAVGFILGNAAA